MLLHRRRHGFHLGLLWLGFTRLQLLLGLLPAGLVHGAPAVRFGLGQDLPGEAVIALAEETLPFPQLFGGFLIGARGKLLRPGRPGQGHRHAGVLKFLPGGG